MKEEFEFQGANTRNSILPAITACDFFLVNEPQPDELDAIDASSFTLAVATVCLAVGTTFELVDDVRPPDEGCPNEAATIVTRSKSSSDGN